MELQKILGKFFENCCQQPLKKNDLGYMQGNLKFLINQQAEPFGTPLHIAGKNPIDY